MTWIWVDGNAAEILAALARLHPHARGAPSREPLPPRPASQSPTIDDIKQVVCDLWGVTPAGVESQARIVTLVEPRQVAMYLARLLCRAQFGVIGQAFGNRDHSTVMHAVEKVSSRMRVHPADDPFPHRVRDARDIVLKNVPDLTPEGTGDSTQTSTPVENTGVDTVLKTDEGPEC